MSSNEYIVLSEMSYFTMWVVGGQNTNIAAGVQRFITNPVHTWMATEKFQHHSIPISFCLWGQGPLLNQGPFLKSPFNFDISYHANGIEELTFHFLRAHYIFLLHLFPDVASISRLSPATQGPVVRGNTHHRFSIYPLEATSLPICLALFKKPSVRNFFWGQFLLVNFPCRFCNS